MLIILQIIVSVILIVLILMQERSSGLSGVFGGDMSTPYQTRRGVERIVFWSTIGAAIIFVALAIANLVFLR